MVKPPVEAKPSNRGEGADVLKALEKIIAEALGKTEAASLALLEIHERALYRQRYPSFEAYLKERWHMSRSRGYQLLHYARLKQRCGQEQTTAPPNERQARQLDRQGKARVKDPNEADPIMQVMEIITNAFERHPQPERGEFLHWIRYLLDVLECQLEREGALSQTACQTTSTLTKTQNQTDSA